MKDKKLIYCFDLDNTLCETKGNIYEDAKPIPSRIEYVNKLFNQGHKIIIDTARGCVSGKDWFPFTTRQLEGWGVKYHQLRTGIKFGADVFIDDKALSDKDFFQD